MESFEELKVKTSVIYVGQKKNELQSSPSKRTNSKWIKLRTKESCQLFTDEDNYLHRKAEKGMTVEVILIVIK